MLFAERSVNKACLTEPAASYTAAKHLYRRSVLDDLGQPSTRPPTFVMFVNRAELFHFSYQRYIENQVRQTFGLEGTPVKFIIRERDRDDK